VDISGVLLLWFVEAFCNYVGVVFVLLCEVELFE
jgi:hypothetical protein